MRGFFVIYAIVTLCVFVAGLVLICCMLWGGVNDTDKRLQILENKIRAGNNFRDAIISSNIKLRRDTWIDSQL
jgi:hypothetical protein